jgi:hypothetical protein
VTVNEHANGTTTKLVVQDTLVVTLHSTYWQLNSPSPSPGPLREKQPPSTKPGTNCGHIPGTGCGTVTATYTATATGTAHLTAHRTTCGEALRCEPGQTDWSIEVRITHR